MAKVSKIIRKLGNFIHIDGMLNNILGHNISMEEKLDRLLVIQDSKKPVGHPDQAYGGRTYSQFGEDLLVLNIFNAIGIKNPSYIDIGAHHPYTISNTALLYLRGSRGINIEANPTLYENFTKERPGDINLCVGIGVENAGKTMPFYMLDKWNGRNSFDKKSVEEFIQTSPGAKITEILDIPIITLEEVISKYSNGICPDYMDIDVEGLDYYILRNHNLKDNGPKVLSVEDNLSSDDGNSQNLIKELVMNADYFLYCKLGSNMIFVKNCFKDFLY